jgi:hypothetical protein
MDKIKYYKKDLQDTKVVDLSKDKKLKKSVLSGKRTLVSMMVLLLSLMLVTTLFAPTALATEDDSDDDGIDDETEELNERGVRIEREPKEVEIKSVLVNDDVIEEIEVEMRYEAAIKVKFEFSKYNNSVEPELEITLEFREIIEFKDENDNGAFDSGDEEVSVYNLRETDYDDINYFTRNTLDNETEHVLEAQTSDGIFKVVLHVVGNFAEIESGILTPSEIKLDLIIQNYPYEEDDTQLALMSKLEAGVEVEDEEEHESEHGEIGEDHLDEEEDEHEEKLVISTPDALGFFSWADTAEVDGVSTPVKTTKETEGEGGVKLYFAYERGTSINHDPKIGVPYLTVTPGASDSDFDLGMKLIPYLGALLVGAIVIGMVVFWRKKKNGHIER